MYEMLCHQTATEPCYSAFWVPRSAIFITNKDPPPGGHCVLRGPSHGRGTGRYIREPNKEGLKRRQTPKSMSGQILKAGWSPLSDPGSCNSLLLTTLPAVLRTAPPCPPAPARAYHRSPGSCSCLQQPLEKCVQSWNKTQPFALWKLLMSLTKHAKHTTCFFPSV